MDEPIALGLTMSRHIVLTWLPAARVQRRISSDMDVSHVEINEVDLLGTCVRLSVCNISVFGCNVRTIFPTMLHTFPREKCEHLPP